MSDVAARIRAHLDALSPNDLRIAHRVLDHPALAPFETAESLAAKVGVSKAAVVRFAVRVGYEGFAQLNEALRDEAVAKLSAPQEPPEGGDVIDAVASRARADLAAMRLGVDRTQFAAAVSVSSRKYERLI
jgi:DNA-binding MurR/RpiR family transcriptional regulator